MQIDFHYYCVGVLARAAGFKTEDALTIAYASQYTDDSTESEPIRLILDDVQIQFEPVCTTYAHLEDLARSVLNWSLQKRVYLPFHFIPTERFQRGKPKKFSFVTQANSSFANWLLDKSCKEENDKLRLCRMGVALHSYADTWAHQGFSGRLNKTENNIGTIQVQQQNNGEYEKISPFEQMVLDGLPALGHAEAGYYPDLSNLKWSYKRQPKRVVKRNNVEDRMLASKAIYEYLCSVPNDKSDYICNWDDIKEKLKRCFEYAPKMDPILGQSKLLQDASRIYYALEVDKRCQKWQKTFDYLFEPSNSFSYDKHCWRKEAFGNLVNVNWDNNSIEDWLRFAPIKITPEFWDSHWVHFHQAALKQRHLILENIP